MYKRFAFVIFLVVSNIFSQNNTPISVYYDAMGLNSALPSNKNAYFDILKKYLPGKGEDDDVEKAFKDNPFFGNEVSNMKPTGRVSIRSVDYKSFFDLSSTFGQAYQNQLISVLTNFYVNRAKDEIQTFFLENIRDAVKGKDEYKVLFPNTYSLFQMDDATWLYGSSIQLLKNSLQQDLNEFHKHLPVLLTTQQKYSDIIKSSTALQYLIDLLTLYNGIESGKHPVDFISDIDELQIVKNSTDGNIKLVLAYYQTISRTLREKGDEPNAWISFEKYKALQNAKKYFLGLAYYLISSQNIKVNGATITIGKFIEDNKVSPNDVKSFVTENVEQYLETTELIQKSIDRIRAFREKAEIVPQDLYIEYIASSSELFAKLFSFTLPGQTSPIKFNNINDVEIKSIYRVVRQLYTASIKQQYSGVITNGLLLLQKTVKDQVLSDNKQFFRYTSFFAVLAEAKSSEDMAKAIESAALPPGSYSIKRRADFNVSLNSFVGIYYGTDAPEGVGNKTKTSYGATVPTGIAISYGNWPDNWLCLQGASFFISLFDFGIPLSVRYSSDSSQIPSNLQFKHLINLGGGCFFHFKNAPVSVGGFYVHTADLREIQGYADRKSTWRFGITATIDIPMFDLYTSTE